MARLDRLGPAREAAQMLKPEAELASTLDRLVQAGLLFRVLHQRVLEQISCLASAPDETGDVTTVGGNFEK